MVVKITGNTAQLNKAIDKAQDRMGRFRKGAGIAFAAVRRAAIGLAIGGAAAITGFAIGAIKNFADLGDELDKMSKRTGFSVESLGELKFAAEQSGSSLEDVEKAAKRMSSAILDLEDGLTEATRPFERLGITLDDLKGKRPEDQFQLIALALAGVEDATTRAALAQDIFGRSGTALLPLFIEGEKGMEALRQQARDLGIVMSTESAADAADFKDSLNELKSAVSGLGLAFSGTLVPRITGFIRLLVGKKAQVQAFFDDIKASVQPFVSSFVAGILTIWPLIRAFFEFIYKNKPLLIAAIVAVGIAIVNALGPLSLAAIALVGLITLIGYVRENWDTIWGAILTTFKAVTSKIVDLYESKWGWLLPYGPFVKAILFIRDTWRGVWNDMLRAIQAVSGPILAIANRIMNAVSRASSLASSIGGAVSSIIPGMAHGGNVRRGGTALVGERGPELLNLPRGAQVSPLGGGGGGGGTTINYYSLSAADFKREVERVVNSPGAQARAVGRP